MNKYFAIAMLIAFVAWSGFMYHEGYSKKAAVCTSADEKHDLQQAAITVAAQNDVIATVAKQQTITQGVDHDYQAKKNDIDNQYIAGLFSLQPTASTPAGHSLPATTNSTSRSHATATRPFLTRVFRLTAKECDENTEQLYGLQDWEKGQLAIKGRNKNE